MYWLVLEYSAMSNTHKKQCIQRTKRTLILLFFLFSYSHLTSSRADDDFSGPMDTNVRLRYNGEITWDAPAITKSSCVVDVSYFPFDSQECNLTFGSWTYNGNQVFTYVPAARSLHATSARLCILYIHQPVKWFSSGYIHIDVYLLWGSFHRDIVAVVCMHLLNFALENVCGRYWLCTTSTLPHPSPLLAGRYHYGHGQWWPVRLCGKCGVGMPWDACNQECHNVWLLLWPISRHHLYSAASTALLLLYLQPPPAVLPHLLPGPSGFLPACRLRGESFSRRDRSSGPHCVPADGGWEYASIWERAPHWWESFGCMYVWIKYGDCSVIKNKNRLQSYLSCLF